MDNVIKAYDAFRAAHNEYGPDYDDLVRENERLVAALTPEQKVVYDFAVHTYFDGEGDAHQRITGLPACEA